MNSASSVNRTPTGDDKLQQNDTPKSCSWLGRAVSRLTGKMPETMEIEKILSHNLTPNELAFVKKNLKVEIKLFNEQIKNQTIDKSTAVENFRKIFREQIAEADSALLGNDSQIQSLRSTGKARPSRLKGTSNHAKAVVEASKEAFKKMYKKSPRLEKSNNGTTIENSGHISGVRLKDTSVRIDTASYNNKKRVLQKLKEKSNAIEEKLNELEKTLPTEHDWMRSTVLFTPASSDYEYSKLEEEKKQLDAEIKALETVLKNARKSGNTPWIPSSQHRVLAKDEKTVESSALANFRVNARLRTFECADQKNSDRSGCRDCRLQRSRDKPRRTPKES